MRRDAQRKHAPPDDASVAVMCGAAWFFGAAFALVQSPTVGEGVLFYSIFCAAITGVLGSLGAVAWKRGMLPIGPASAMVLIVFAAWYTALAACTLTPRELFVRLDNGLGVRAGPASGGSWVATALLQVVLFGVLLAGARIVRRLERASATQTAEEAVARRMHEALVPDVSVAHGPISVWGRSVPCSSTGGDFIEVFHERGSVTVVIGDVSGHGVGAGILMAMIKGALRVRLRQEITLDRLLSEINEMVLSLNRPGMFVTALAVRVHEDGSAECASAGHLPLLRLDPASPKGCDVHNECLPLGVESEERYGTNRLHLAPGETLALLTDGLVEVQDRAGKQIGMPLIRKVLASRIDAPLPEIFNALAKRCESFGKQSDDQTLVLIRYGVRPPTLEPLAAPEEEEARAAG
ncbi:MAG TPA: PP2C family protein-serine/threonine phosphatase [Phycisphaerales bacterium]|nr:PP2C family protein-serine/threonine phosphatase [Phycisphaerales bacterium]